MNMLYVNGVVPCRLLYLSWCVPTCRGVQSGATRGELLYNYYI